MTVNYWISLTDIQENAYSRNRYIFTARSLDMMKLAWSYYYC